jgi:hypothetical protein
MRSPSRARQIRERWALPGPRQEAGRQGIALDQLAGVHGKLQKLRDQLRVVPARRRCEAARECVHGRFGVSEPNVAQRHVANGLAEDSETLLVVLDAALQLHVIGVASRELSTGPQRREIRERDRASGLRFRLWRPPTEFLGELKHLGEPRLVWLSAGLAQHHARLRGAQVGGDRGG